MTRLATLRRTASSAVASMSVLGLCLGTGAVFHVVFAVLGQQIL